MKKINVTYFHRKPYAGHWSVEAIFATLRALLSGKVNARIKVASFISRGFFKRVGVAIEAAFFQSDVNHITGDIHYIAAFLKPSKTVLTIHDCRILRETPSRLKRKIFYYIWYGMPARHARYITVVSQFTKSELLGYIPTLAAEKITVIPPFISEAFIYSPKEFNKARPNLLHIGTMENKNLGRLAEAIEGISCTLNVIGTLSKEQKEKLLRHKITYRSVSGITGQQMINEYAAADILVFVSTFEGFGMPIIEANRTGRPVLTSNVASMPDIAGNAACLVDPFDVASIRAGLMRLINDDHYRNRLVENGVENAKRFDNEAIAQQYYDLYCRVVSQKLSSKKRKGSQHYLSACMAAF